MRKDAAGVRPLDQKLKEALESYEVSFYLMPMIEKPKPNPGDRHQPYYTDLPGPKGKGKGKGKTGKKQNHVATCVPPLREEENQSINKEIQYASTTTWKDAQRPSQDNHAQEASTYAASASKSIPSARSTSLKR